MASMLARLVALELVAGAGAESCRSGECPTRGLIWPIPRPGEISADEFDAHYLMKTPAVLRHPVPFDLADLLRECPSMPVPVMVPPGAKPFGRDGPESRDGDGTSNRKVLGVDFVGRVPLEVMVAAWASGNWTDHYCFDALPMCFCPELMAKLTVPFFASRDQAFRLFVQDVWPTMMFGADKSGAKMHIDTRGLPFWVLVLEGRKRMRVITIDDIEAYMPSWLGPEYYWGSDSAYGPGFPDIDFFDDEAVKQHVDGRVKVWETTLEAGDLLYIPSWGLHNALNDGICLSLSANWLDQPHAAEMVRTRPTQLYTEEQLEWQKFVRRGRVRVISESAPQNVPAPVTYFQLTDPDGYPWCFSRLLSCFKETHVEPRPLLEQCRASGSLDLPDASVATLVEAAYLKQLSHGEQAEFAAECLKVGADAAAVRVAEVAEAQGMPLHEHLVLFDFYYKSMFDDGAIFED